MTTTIGNLNGPWSVLLKIMLVVFVPWSSFITVNQILDNQFRGEGERFTKLDAEMMVKAVVLELGAEIRQGDALLAQRVAMLENEIHQTTAVEKEETEILRQMQLDIREYIRWLKESKR